MTRALAPSPPDMDDDDTVFHPEDLEKRLLSNFSIYREDGLMATLELLPMWSGVAPDLDLYASGEMMLDDGDFDGAIAAGSDGGPSAGGGSAAGGEREGNMKVYLSSIKEWILDAGFDCMFISVRHAPRGDAVVHAAV